MSGEQMRPTARDMEKLRVASADRNKPRSKRDIDFVSTIVSLRRYEDMIMMRSAGTPIERVSTPKNMAERCCAHR